MKNIFKSILALTVLAFAASSCDVSNVGNILSQNDVDAPAASFVQKVINETELSPSLTSYEIVVGRTSPDYPAQVVVETNLPTGVCPRVLGFSAGDSSTKLVLDLSSLAIGSPLKGTIALKDQAGFTYSSISVTLQKAFKWETYGSCKYTDDIIGPLFGYDPVTYSVVVEKAQGFEMYRLNDPYGKGVFPRSTKSGTYRAGVKWVIDATDPNAVTFDRTKLGVDWGYDEMEAAVLKAGTMVNKVITFPTKGLVVYDADGGYYANNNGAFKLDLNL